MYLYIYIEREKSKEKKKREGRGDKRSLEEKRVKYLKERVEINCHDSSRHKEIISSKKRWSTVIYRLCKIQTMHV